MKKGTFFVAWELKVVPCQEENSMDQLLKIPFTDIEGKWLYAGYHKFHKVSKIGFFSLRTEKKQRFAI